MARPILAIMIATLALAVFASSNLRTEAGASVPASLARWLEPARDAARREAGPVGLLPARLVEARCSADGRTAVLRFESAIGAASSFATIGFPPPEDWNMPGATVTIIGSKVREPEGISVDACTRIPTGPTE